ncbi:site-specific integrase [Cytobacillus sp. FSL H8-0458]|uniref:site-specific integrase n=1 Tax=Cytobacillus sp. FSL H8-0458 TaxID=2975346 RepID=UPI0030FAA412
MSKIKKDPKRGTYFFVLDGGRDPITKKRTQYKRTGFKSKNEAEVALAKIRLELSQNKAIKNVKMTFGDFLKDWMEAKSIKLKPSTKKNYEEQVFYNILPVLGDKTIAEIDDKILQNFIFTLHNKRELAPSTIRTTYGIVSEVLGSASRKGLFDQMLLSDISLPREVKKLRVWDEDQINTFLNAPNTILNLSRHFIGFVISILTGMRMGEVLGLRWKDIDFDKQIIYIRQTLSKIDEEGNYGFIDEGKTASAIRTIYIPTSLIHSLKEHRQLIEKEQKILGDSYLNYDLVLCAKNGNWVHPNNFRRAFKVTVEQLDIPMIRLHDLRHSHATFLLSKQVNPKIIQERLGHKNITVTLNTYSHALPSMQLEAVGKFDEAFSKGD